MKRIIAIDPGHGGSDPGAVGPTGLYESLVAFKIACMVADILMRYGILIIFTRDSDKRVSLDDRIKIANESNADYFVSIHINSAKNNTATGTETYAYSVASEGNKLAHSIQSNLVQAIGLTDRGVKYNQLRVTKETKMPAALTEVAFINNPAEEQLLKQDEFLEKAAVGIVKGILEHLNIDYMPKPKEEKVMSWQEKQGLEAVKNLNKKVINGKPIIETPDHWEDKMLESMPTWAVMSLLDRITNK